MNENLTFDEAKAQAAKMMEARETPDEAPVPYVGEGEPEGAAENEALDEPAAQMATDESSPAENGEGAAPGPLPANDGQNASALDADNGEQITAAENGQDMLMELQRLRAENQQLRETAFQQSEQVREGALNNARPQTPNINYADLAEQIAYGSDSEKQGALEALVAKASEAGFAKAMEAMKPMREQYESAVREREYDAALGQFASLPGMEGIGDMRDDLRKIGDKFFGGLEPADQIARARVYKMGLDALNNPPVERKFTREDALEMYKNDPELRRAIEAARYGAAKAADAADAPVYRSGGMGNAAPTMPKIPQTLDDATAMAKEYFRR